MGLGVGIYTLFSNLLARTFYFVPKDNEREGLWEGFEMLLGDGPGVHRPPQTV
jgi:hypothetical protein